MISYSYVDKEMMVKLRGEEVLWYKMNFFWIELLFVSISIKGINKIDSLEVVVCNDVFFAFNILRFLK